MFEDAEISLQGRGTHAIPQHWRQLKIEILKEIKLRIQRYKLSKLAKRNIDPKQLLIRSKIFIKTK